VSIFVSKNPRISGDLKPEPLKVKSFELQIFEIMWLNITKRLNTKLFNIIRLIQNQFISRYIFSSYDTWKQYFLLHPITSYLFPQIKLQATSNNCLLKHSETVLLVMLGTSSFPARNELFSCFSIYLVPRWERARTQHD